MDGLTRAERSGPMQEIIYGDDPIWHDPTLPVYDPHRMVWIADKERLALGKFLGGERPRQSEKVKVTYPGPQRVELDVTLDSPGIVVLADFAYPGWKLTIDGKPAPVYKVNRVMRGAAVEAGTYHLVYTFDPASFRIGGILTLAGLATTVLLSVFCALRPGARQTQEGLTAADIIEPLGCPPGD